MCYSTGCFSGDFLKNLSNLKIVFFRGYEILGKSFYTAMGTKMAAQIMAAKNKEIRPMNKSRCSVENPVVPFMVTTFAVLR